VDLVRGIGRYRSIFLLDGELSGVVGDVVVAEHARRAKRGTDRVRTTRDRLTRRAGVGGSDAIACQETYQCTGKGRISAAIGLVRGIGRYRSVLLLNGKLGRVVGDVIVTKYRCRTDRRSDFIGAAGYSLTRSAVIGSSDAIRCQEANQGPGKRWIGAAVDFAGRIRCDRSVLLLDREVGGIVGDIVVPEHTCRRQSRADRVRAARHGFAGRASVGGSDTVACEEPNQCAGKCWIGAAVDLVGRIRCHRSVLFVDREVSRVVSDVIVTVHTCRAKCRSDLVGTGRYHLTGSARICGSDAVPGEEPN